MKSSSRNGARVRVLAVHTTEGIMRAVDLRAWTAWPGSSHAAADDTGVLLDGAGDGFVDHARAAWTLRSGNPWSENIELCAHAKWTRAQWLARPTLLELCAVWLARRSAARGIPLVKITPAQYRAGASGVIGHHDHTVGYSDGTHWDPGPGFPWDVVLARARAVFDSWRSPFRLALVADGAPDVTAHSLATTALAALEGAVILSRAERGLTPLDQTAGVLRELLARSTRPAR